jgi:hypothetical protein
MASERTEVCPDRAISIGVEALEYISECSTFEEWPPSSYAILLVRQVMYTAYIGRCRVASLIHLRGYLESGS